MKLIKSYNTALRALAIFLLIFTNSGCKKFLGLDFQKDVEHVVNPPIDPHIKMSPWEFLKANALATNKPSDTTLELMYKAVIYSEFDTTEYSKPGRTFIFLNDDAIFRIDKGATTNDSYFGKYKVRVGNSTRSATRWEDYTNKMQIRNYLLSLIVMGEHSFDNIDIEPKFEKTILPPNTDTLNPENIIAFRIRNDINSRIRLNEFSGTAVPSATSTGGIEVVTGGLISTSGPIHIISRVLFYQKQTQ